MLQSFYRIAKIICLLSLVSNFTASYATEHLAKKNDSGQLKNKTLRIGVSNLNHYPSFNFEANQNKGACWEILELFAAQHNYIFDYIPLPKARLQSELEKGEIDLVFPDNPLWTAHKSKPDNNIYSNPIIRGVSATFVDEFNKDIIFTDVRSVSIPFGYTATKWSPDDKDHTIYIMPARDLEIALHRVKIGSTIAASVDYNAGLYIISNNPSLTNLVVNHNLPYSKVTYHMSTFRNVELLEQLSQFLINNEKHIEEIKIKFGLKTYNEVFSPVAKP